MSHRIFIFTVLLLSLCAKENKDVTKNFDSDEWELVQKIHQAIQQKKDDEFKAYTEVLKPGVNLTMLAIPKGDFLWRGSKKNDLLEVELSAFWMAEKEVTWEEYEDFMSSKIPRDKEGLIPAYLRSKQKDPSVLVASPTVPYMTMNYGMAQKNHPAEGLIGVRTFMY